MGLGSELTALSAALQEKPEPWPLPMLGVDPSGRHQDQADTHPFYPLKDFSLLNQEPLSFPKSLMVSRNYFNPAWGGLRRIKNVIVVRGAWGRVR